jgi:ribosomal protein L40E
MTEPNKPPEAAPFAGGQRPEKLQCAKCHAENPRHRNTCSACGAHLHILCHQCGHRNPRVANECAQCGKRLHRGLVRRIERRLFKLKPGMTVFQVVLLVVAVYVAYVILVKLAEVRLP